MTTLQVKIKPNLSVSVTLQDHSSELDTAHLKWTASLLATIAAAIDEWQAKYGTLGCPMPPPSMEETQGRLERKR